jgi:ABC-type bacteriocin/lantibiotic exporter with double-glycine peptidase domain
MKLKPFFLLLLFLSASCVAASTKESSTRLLIKNFPNTQQSLDYTCGPSSAVSLAKFYGIKSDELTAIEEIKPSPEVGTTPEKMANWLTSKGLKVTWSENGTLDLLKDNLKKGIPTLVEWIDWGGHWVVVIGMDDKGTPDTADDEIILADPYDRVDGKPDGLTYFNMERFDSMWFDAFYFGKPMKKIYMFVNQSPARTE